MADDDPALVLRPTSAIEGAPAERDRLLDIIDRAAEALKLYSPRHLTRLADYIEEPGRFFTVGMERQKELAAMFRSLASVLTILAEADPAEREGAGDD